MWTTIIGAFILVLLSAIHPEGLVRLWIMKVLVILPYIMFIYYRIDEFRQICKEEEDEASIEPMYDVIRKLCAAISFGLALFIPLFSIAHGGFHCYGSFEVLIGVIGYSALVWNQITLEQNYKRFVDLDFKIVPNPSGPKGDDC